MPKRLQLKLPFDSDLSDHIKNNFSDIEEYRIISKSLDARGAPRGKKPIFQYTLETLVAGEQFEHLSETVKPLTPSKNPPIWIGAGPAGLFGALRLTEHGLPSIIIERGEVATKRMLFIAKFWRYGEFNNESNVCYGEGGAGLFSDGKLITRIKSPFVKYVMQKFVDFGAPAETGYMSNPHLGSNKIRKIITQMSDHLHSKGCKIYYNTRVDEILFENTADSKKAIGVLLNNGEKLYSDHIVLATGHSAKEMYAHLLENDVAIKGKDFAVGVRIEHPREVIDKIQHGDFCASPVLGSAKYKLTHHNRDSRKGTYSFCMCPGGYVLSSGTESDGIVVNGMSNYARNSRWSNSAIVVSINAGEDFSKDNILAGLKFQQEIEQKAYQLSKKHASGKELPAVTLGEFLNDKLDKKELPKTSSPSGLFKADLKEIFPEFVINHLKEGLTEFSQKLKGFGYSQALLIAPETRTSAPVTVLRDKFTLQSISHQGLYPCGEGAGYAGGITSAAVDGVKAAEAIAQQHMDLT